MGGQPTQRQDVGEGRGLGLQRQPRLGDDSRDARVVERAHHCGRLGTGPANDDRELAPGDGVLDVDASQLASDRRVLFGVVESLPRLDRRALRFAPEPVRHGEVHGRAGGEVGLELPQRAVGRALEGEDV